MFRSHNNVPRILELYVDLVRRVLTSIGTKVKEMKEKHKKAKETSPVTSKKSQGLGKVEAGQPSDSKVVNVRFSNENV
jgi:hypothetical protein